MSFVCFARIGQAAAIALLLGQSALAQGMGAQSSAKLGAPDLAAAARPQADPGTLFGYASSVGKVLQFVTVGTTAGTIWGDGTYTSDSLLSTAAVHAGLLQPGESGIVSVEMVPGLDAYEGVERHGVTSRSYQSWNVAYRFIGVAGTAGGVVLPDPGDVSGHRGKDGAILTFEVTGDAAGEVWGDGVYTDDSRLATAAVHAGVLQAGETGLVQLEILPAQDGYVGAEHNGVVSGTYGAWPGSFRILPALSLKAASKLSNMAGQ